MTNEGSISRRRRPSLTKCGVWQTTSLFLANLALPGFSENTSSSWIFADSVKYQLPVTGYINRVLSTMNTLGETSQKYPVVLLHQICKSQVCVEALAYVFPLNSAMKLRKDLVVVVCVLFNRMFSFKHNSLVSQARSCGLVKDLLIMTERCRR